MKKILTSVLSIMVLPALLAAQPTVTNNEFYYIGNVFPMIDCGIPSTGAGTAGAMQTWDFSDLGIGAASTLAITASAAAAFPTANVLITLPDGLQQYVQESSSDSYITGTVDTVSGITAYYDNYHIAKRPFTYLTSFIDTYYVSVGTPVINGRGILTVTGDAYGSITLPTGTYNNVLRIRKYQYEVDTFGSSSGTYSTFTVSTSYLWFDGVHAAPLLEIDSVNNSATGITQSARYLAGTTGIENIAAIQPGFSGYMDNNELVLNGAFIAGMPYEVIMFNVIGNKVFEKEFTGSGSQERFNTGQLAAGIYIVSIAQKNDESSREVIKVIKN